MRSRHLFGTLLVMVGLVYLWLAWMSVVPQIQNGDFVVYLSALLFLIPGLGAAFAGVNLLRAKRR